MEVSNEAMQPTHNEEPALRTGTVSRVFDSTEHPAHLYLLYHAPCFHSLMVFCLVCAEETAYDTCQAPTPRTPAM